MQFECIIDTKAKGIFLHSISIMAMANAELFFSHSTAIADNVNTSMH